MLIKIPIRILVGLIAIPIVSVVAFTAYLYIDQESMIFASATLPQDHQFAFDVTFEEVTISVDGADINGLHFQQSNPRGLIFFLHGNSGNLDSWTTNVDYYQRVNYDMFMIDYRGYGKSTGTIQSEAQLHADVRLAWDSVAPQYGTKSTVSYGRSLGTALAAELAADVNPDLLILVSPFRSMVAMARRQYPFLPEWLVRYPLRTDKVIGAIQTPTIIMHGAEDSFVPLTHSYELRDLARTSAKLLVIEGAGHNDVHKFSSYIDGLTSVLPD